MLLCNDIFETHFKYIMKHISSTNRFFFLDAYLVFLKCDFLNKWPLNSAFRKTHFIQIRNVYIKTM